MRSRMSCASWTKPWSKWRIAMPPKVHCCRCSPVRIFQPRFSRDWFVPFVEAMSLPMIQMSAMKKLDFWLVQRWIPLHFDIFRLTKSRFQLVTPTVPQSCWNQARNASPMLVEVPACTDFPPKIKDGNGKSPKNYASMGQSLPWQFHCSIRPSKLLEPGFQMFFFFLINGPGPTIKTY